jgi:hypothetical protein
MSEQHEYNDWFREMVAKHCPDLFAEISEKSHEGREYLMATIPHSDEKKIISLSTYGRELTPFIHTHHCHFDQFRDDDHEEEFLSAVEWIRDFMNNKLFICTHYDGDRIASTMSTYDNNDLKARKNCRMEILTYYDDPRPKRQTNG